MGFLLFGAEEFEPGPGDKAEDGDAGSDITDRLGDGRFFLDDDGLGGDGGVVGSGSGVTGIVLGIRHNEYLSLCVAYCYGLWFAKFYLFNFTLLYIGDFF